MALAFYLAFIPHYNYPYPVHLDEWIHLAISEAIIRDASIAGITEPMFTAAPVHNQIGEVGYHLFWGIFHQISGISWLAIFRYFPGIVLILIVLSVYILARRQGFGWEAALFTCLIPTTVGILGPGFFVPVIMGLLFITLCLFLAFNFRTTGAYLALFILAGCLLTIHIPTAAGLVIILAPYILINLKNNWRHSLWLVLALATPFILVILLLPFHWISSNVASMAKILLSPHPPSPHVDLPPIITTYGYLPVLFCLLGTFRLAIRGEKRDYGLILGLLALLLMLAIFFTFHYGLSMMYERGLIYMMLMASVVAGAGLALVKNLTLPKRLAAPIRAPVITRNIGAILCVILIGLTLATCIPVRQNITYYHMIDQEDYEAFIWIRQNVGSNYDRAILDPWKGIAFVATTGKEIYTWIGVQCTPKDTRARDFLRDGCKDTTFMKDNHISIIYTQQPCQNPDLVEVRQNVYLLKEAHK